jgi:hypothetical protein
LLPSSSDQCAAPETRSVSSDRSSIAPSLRSAISTCALRLIAAFSVVAPS